MIMIALLGIIAEAIIINQDLNNISLLTSKKY